jgi:hypothetical protein
MQNDTNTYGYNQWFYFAIKNTRPGKVYTFRIANFVLVVLSIEKKLLLLQKRNAASILFS